MKLKDVPDNMKRRIKTMLNMIWGYIAADALEGTKNGTLRKGLVIELVLDADRVKTFGDDKEAVEVFYSLSDTEQMKIAREAFIYKTYC